METLMDCSTDIAVGDVVTLKSGGPKMTVGNINADAVEKYGEPLTLDCFWFVDGKMQSCRVLPAMLTKVEP